MLKRLSSYAAVLLGLMVLVSSCKKEYESIQSMDDKKIADYISRNSLSVTKDPEGSGFYYTITNQGTGEFYKNTDSVRYSVIVRSLFNGNEYYSTPEYVNSGTFVGYTNGLLGLDVKAMRTLLTQLRPGGAGRIILPSYMAYGKNGFTTLNVPSNEILDITVITYAESQAMLDDGHIRKFLTANNLTATKDISGVYYIVTDPGTGTEVIDNNSVITFNYTGRLLEGNVFQSATDYITTIPGSIEGMGILSKFKNGAKVRLIIPSVLGYGAQETRGTNNALIIPGHASLDYDVEITSVEN